MKINEQDILTTQKMLKENPFVVPEGYFDSFRSDAAGRIRPKSSTGWSRKIAPYIAVAASLAILLGVGTTLFHSIPESFSEEDYILFSDNMIRIDLEEDSVTEQFAEAELYDEDIIEYLIYIGESPESIELSK
jgi:hypothetical protein